MRRAVTLIELMLALVVFGLVMALVARAAQFHERFERRERSVAQGDRAAAQAVAIAAGALAALAPDDLVRGAASDSAVEFMDLVGAGVACGAGDSLVVPAAGRDGLVSLAAVLRAGDRLLLFDDAHSPARWNSYAVTAVRQGRASCALFASGQLDATILRLDASLGSPRAVPFRAQRRTRFDLYRSSDGGWYLGLRDWNGATGQFNGVQPVAGPLLARSVDSARTGLRFTYLGNSGAPLEPPLDSAVTVRGVEIVARPADTAGRIARRVVALRPGP